MAAVLTIGKRALTLAFVTLMLALLMLLILVACNTGAASGVVSSL